MRVPVALALLMLACAGCSGGDGGREPLPEEWRGRDLREPGWANQTVPPGYMFALEYEWSSGKGIAYDWFVFQPTYLHFQVVRLDGGQPQALVSQDAQEGKDRLTVVQGGKHQIDWLNEYTQQAVIAYKVPEGGRHILYPPQQGPGCVRTLVC